MNFEEKKGLPQFNNDEVEEEMRPTFKIEKTRSLYDCKIQSVVFKSESGPS